MFDRIGKYLSFDRPGRLLAVFLFVSGVVWVIFTSLLHNILPLDVVEAVVWGNQMQLGQMKSPPLSGWLATAFWHLAGRHDWGLYLLAELTVWGGMWFTYKLAREFVDEYGAASATLLVYFLYYYNPPAMKFCSHDTQVLLLPAMTLYFVRALRDDDLMDWLLLAVLSALAVLGKYSAVQLLLAYAVVLAATKTGRKRLASYKPYLCAAVIAVLLLPHIVWVFQHGFLSVLHMRERLESSHGKPNRPFWNLLVMLYPYINSVIVLLVAGSPWRREMRERRAGLAKTLRLLLPLALIPPGIYVLLSFCGEKLVEQWFSYFSYLSGLVMVLVWPFRFGRREFKRLFIAMNVFTVILLVGGAADLLARPRIRIHSKPGDIVAAGEDFWRRHGAGRPLTAVYGDRWLAGVMELYSTSRPSACAEGDVCAWELVRERVRRDGMLLVEQGEPPRVPEFLPEVRADEIVYWKYTHRFTTPSGRSKTRDIWFGYLPPR